MLRVRLKIAASRTVFSLSIAPARLLVVLWLSTALNVIFVIDLRHQVFNKLVVRALLVNESSGKLTSQSIC